MAFKVYDRKNKTFYIRKPKLIHIGCIKNNKKNVKLTEDDKIRICNFVDKVELFGIEFGAREIISTSTNDIFKIREECRDDKNFTNKAKIKKMRTKKKSTNINRIKKQLGLNG